MRSLNRPIKKILIHMLSFLALTYLLPSNMIYVAGWSAALVAAVIYGLLNYTIKPVLSLLALPLTIVTLGIFQLVINGLMLLLTSQLVSGFYVGSGFQLIIVAFLLTICGYVIRQLLD